MSINYSDSYRNVTKYTGQGYNFTPVYVRNRDPVNGSGNPPTVITGDIRPKEQQGKYPLGSLWVNYPNNKIWALVSIIQNKAKWILLSTASGNPLISLSDNVDKVVLPSSDSAIPPGNIQLTGQVYENGGASNFATVVADPSNNSIAINPMSSARWIVDSLGINGTHTTIQAAINSAFAGDTIFILPGTYTENPTLSASVNLAAYDCDSTTPNVTISGNITFSNSSGSLQTVSISGINLQTNNNYFLTVSGTSDTILYLNNCYLNCLNYNGISFTNSNSASRIFINFCNGNLQTTGITFHLSSSPGSINYFSCNFINSGSSTTASSNSNGSANWHSCSLFHSNSCSSSGTLLLEDCAVEGNALATTLITTAGTGLSNIHRSRLTSGTASSISSGSGTTLSITTSDINSSNTNAIIGSGTILIGQVNFLGNSGVTTTTQNLCTAIHGAYRVALPASSYSVLSSDYFIGAITASAAPTITLPAAPTNGEKHCVKDISANASSHNITISGNGNNIVGATSASTYTISNNGGSVELIYDGTNLLWYVTSKF